MANPSRFMLQSRWPAGYVRTLGAFNNETDLKCLASTYPSGKRGNIFNLVDLSVFGLSAVKLVISEQLWSGNKKGLT